MPTVLAYHRPGTLAEAGALLATTGRVAVAGGTLAVPAGLAISDSGVEVVDLQALGLDMIMADAGRLGIGAMVRLTDLLGDPRVPTLIRELAKRELPQALRNQATIGGTVGAGSVESVLLAGLLAHGATVEIHGNGSVPLAEALASGFAGRLITSVTVDSSGVGAIAATGRTPADDPIVAAVAAVTGDVTRLALTGVAASPVLADPADPTAGLQPPGDFRGTSEYRLHLVEVLSARVLAELS